MARKIWKLGKFDKGINSYTDPKDIKDNEWVELDDVNVSKVGVAQTLGIPVPDTAVHHTQVGNLIPGKGLYRFNSDNSYMPSGLEASNHILENTQSAGGSTKSKSEFSIESLVWVFTVRPTYGNLKFQLLLDSTPMTDVFTVLGDDGGDDFDFKAGIQPGASEEIDTNLFTESGNFDFEYLFDNDDAPVHSGVAGDILFHSYASSAYNAAATNQDWFTYGVSFQGDVFVPRSANFWHPDDQNGVDGDTSEISHNLNNRGLFFDATYATDGEPNPHANIDGTQFMMGFYKWPGYNDGVLAYNIAFCFDGFSGTYYPCADGEPQAIDHSGFTIPFNYYDEDGTYTAYKKCRIAFMSALIQQINSFTGEGVDDRFYATFRNSEGFNIGAPDLAAWVPDELSAEWPQAPHHTEEEDDWIYLQARNTSIQEGAIKCAFTYDNLTSGGGDLVDEVVHLLDDRDTYGQGYLKYPSSNWDAPNDEDIETLNVSAAEGGAMVLSGQTSLQHGTGNNQKENWRLTIKGNPSSGLTIKISLTDSGPEIGEGSFTLIANYATNEAFVIDIKAKVDEIALYSTGDVTLDSGSASDPYPGFFVDITTDTPGYDYAFAVVVEWIGDAALTSSSIGVEDEQICLVNRTNTDIEITASTINNARLTDFKIYSTFSSTWITAYSNASLASIDDNNMNKYLNWYYTVIEDNNPLFYDEGNILRIVETNFSLKKDLEVLIADGAVSDGISNTSGGNMRANPSQWIGYKDITTHFKDADGNPTFSYISGQKGFNIGLLHKMWDYSLSGDFGLSQSLNDTVGTTGTNILVGEAKMKIFMEKGVTGGIDWTGHIKVYAVACYDDGSETLLSHQFTTAAVSGANYFDDDDNVNTLKIQVLFRPANDVDRRCFSDMRINGVRLYYTHSDENHSTFWNLGKIDFNRGFIKAATIDTTDTDSATSGNESKYEWAKVSDVGLTSSGEADADINIALYNSTSTTTIIEYTEMPKTEAYEDINGCSSQNNTLFVDFKTACIAGRRTFVGNIRVWNGSDYEYYNDRMVVSPVNALDTFPYPDNVLDVDISDGDEIVALSAYGDKVIQFKKRICYILNISTGIASEFFVEERHKWKGILDKNHFCTTDDGIFWFNERGAWIYNGEEIRDLFILGDEEESQQVIDRDTWNDFVSSDSLVGYNAYSREIIIVKNHTYATEGDSDCFVFSLIVNSWTKGIKRFFVSRGKSMTNMQSAGSLGKLSFLSEEQPDGTGQPAEIH